MARLLTAETLSMHRRSHEAELYTLGAKQLIEARVGAAARLIRRFLAARPIMIALHRWHSVVNDKTLRVRRIDGSLSRWLRRCKSQGYFIWRSWAIEMRLSQNITTMARYRGVEQMSTVLNVYLIFKSRGSCFRRWLAITEKMRHHSHCKNIAITSLNSISRGLRRRETSGLPSVQMVPPYP